ncbi:MAG: MFS transporter [Alphaproteobacteria bacterium]|nr:MFS transporter [Alphaproteobacteria bacterium]
MSIKTAEIMIADTQWAWLALGLLCCPAVVLAFDFSTLYLALSHIAVSFNTTPVEELWILDISPLMLAGFLIPMGGMCDRWGNSRVLLIGAAFFTVLLAIASMTPTASALIIVRAAMGIAGATLMPATLGLIRELFQNAEQRRRAFSIFTSAYMSGFALGPIIGGALLDLFGWRATFFLAVPIMLPLLMANPMIFRKSKTIEGQRDYDWLSSILFLASILPFVHGLQELVRVEINFRTALCLVCGLLAGGMFVWRQLNARYPLLDLNLIFSNSGLANALLTLFLAPSIINSLTFFVPQYLQFTYGLSAVAVGASIALAALGKIIGALLSPTLSRKAGSAGVIIGMGLLAVSLGLITIMFGVDLGPAWVLAGLFVVYLGNGPLDTLGTDIMVSSAPYGKSASAAAAAETAIELGGGLGIAIFGILGTAHYQRILTDRLISGHMESSVIERALNSFSVVMAEAFSLGGVEGAYLQEQASAAFASSITTVAGYTIILALFLSLLSFVFLRKTA